MILQNSLKANSESPYILVLTHDIDVLSLKELPVIGRTFWGFVYRCLVINLKRLLSRRLQMSEYIDSLKCILLLPFAKMGVARDPWEEALQVMLEIEERYGVRSTLFFIPFNGKPGHTIEGKPAPHHRASHYRLDRYQELLQELVDRGWEIGVHGIDAYFDLENAQAELAAIKNLISGQSKVGIRMHWLYYKREETWKILDAAGYAYDATLGWNDRIGFPEGWYGPFRPEGIKNLVVLPLNVQDGALLGEWHMDLSNEKAWHQIENVLKEAKEHRAVVTILWHNNSFVAPRYWGWLYEKILQKAKEDCAYICRAIDAVEMFLRGEAENVDVARNNS